MSQRRAWWVALVVGVVVVGGYFLLPRQGLAQSLVYNAVGLVYAVVMVVGVRLFRPARPAMWYLFAAGQLMFVIGDVIWEIYEYVLHLSPYPSPADIFYLACYPLLAAGLVLLVRERHGRDLAGLIDAAILATGVGLVFGVFVLHPIAAEAGSVLERLIGTAYPAADVLLLALVARLFTGGGQRTVSTKLLGAAALLMLVADVVYAVLNQYSSYDGGNPLDALYLMSYVLWGVAALHPSMAPSTAPVDRARPTGLGRRRLVTLTASSLLAPALLFVPATMRHNSDLYAVAAGAIVLFLLVAARMSGFVRQVQRQAGQLEDLALHDDLTGLANRRHFLRRLSEALGAGRPAVVRINVNGFKNVNDQYGHTVGDRLLIALARKIEKAAGGGGLAARMSGDEFAVLVPDAAGAPAVLNRIARAFAVPTTAGDHALLMRVSIGYAEAGDTSEPLELLRRADIAVFAAADDGEPCRYTPELDATAHEEASLGADLRTALDAGDFRLVYQPIVELPHGRLIAVETLVRWTHPVRGPIGPDVFIPIAERTGVIVELGAWILRAACHQAATWRATLGPDAPGRISVNVSPRQLARPGLAEMVAAALADSGLPAGCLTIEVTETAVLDGGPSLQALHDLRALGVLIALDDFGTGHSSLTLLRTVPAQILKVDKSFIDEIATPGGSAVIAGALIEIANGLGMTAVAEGVETADQADRLDRLGYRLAQGYHFGRPAPELPVSGDIALEAGRVPVAG
ncbi:bifunctional diguanylate cyclase/phosphodiesterase [Actinoplanes sp. NPDC049596]|uniref:putative bifunctional diguanylate cyclase/phosphodiesterase n=1 Tax=unclassified Actinoplanes TaxID=2626549 RepID=UPI003436BEEB